MAGLVCECERVCAPILQEGEEVEGEEGHLFTLFFQRRPSTLHTYLPCARVCLGGAGFAAWRSSIFHGNIAAHAWKSS